MFTRLPGIEADIIALGVFLLFLVSFIDYVIKKIGPTIGSWFNRS